MPSAGRVIAPIILSTSLVLAPDVGGQSASATAALEELVQQGSLPVAYLKASNPGEGDVFGTRLDLDGDTLVIGAGNEDSAATGVDGDQSDDTAQGSGAVYVFVRDGETWVQQAYLKAHNTDPGDLFGVDVAVSGDTILVGASGEDSSATTVDGDGLDNSASSAGAAYVFVRDGTTWTQQAYLKAYNASLFSTFGYAVDVEGDWAVVSSIGDLGFRGGVHVFRRFGTTWTQSTHLLASNGEPGDELGVSVSLSGNTLIVGAPSESSNAAVVNGDGTDNSLDDAGAAYVFVRQQGLWSEQAYLKATHPGAGDLFGFSVAVAGDLAAVGATNEDGPGFGVDGSHGPGNADTTSSGAVYLFRRTGTAWAPEAYLKATNPGSFDDFGRFVDVSGDRVAVGANAEDSSATGFNGDESDEGAPNSGAVYVFTREAGVWSPSAYVKAPNAGAGDSFDAAALSGNTLVVGADLEDSAAPGVGGDQTDNSLFNAGAVYVTIVPPTRWTTLDGGTPGSAGTPALVGYGILTPGKPVSLTVTRAPPSTTLLAWISFAPTPFAALGGTVHAFPFSNQLFFASDAEGLFSAQTSWPAGVPSGVEVWFQFLVADPTVPGGITLTNGLMATAP